MLEKALQQAVIDLAHTLGWSVVHFPAAQGANGVWRTGLAADAKGWVDLVLVRERVIYAELKGTGGRIRPDQDIWRERLVNAGQEYYLWTPKSYPTLIAEVLR